MGLYRTDLRPVQSQVISMLLIQLSGRTSLAPRKARFRMDYQNALSKKLFISVINNGNIREGWWPVWQ